MNKTKTKTKTTPADRRIADLLPRSMGLGANPLTAEERSEYNRLVTQRAIAQAEALNPDDADAPNPQLGIDEVCALTLLEWTHRVERSGNDGNLKWVYGPGGHCLRIVW